MLENDVIFNFLIQILVSMWVPFLANLPQRILNIYLAQNWENRTYQKQHPFLQNLISISRRRVQFFVIISATLTKVIVHKHHQSNC